MAEEARPQYKVIGAYVTLTTATAVGLRRMGFKQGAIVPADVPQEQIDHHLRVGLIAPSDAAPVSKTRRSGA